MWQKFWACWVSLSGWVGVSCSQVKIFVVAVVGCGIATKAGERVKIGITDLVGTKHLHSTFLDLQ